MKAAMNLVLLVSLTQVVHGLFFDDITNAFILLVMVRHDISPTQVFFENRSDHLEERSLKTSDGLTRWFLERQPLGGMENGAAVVLFLHQGGGTMYNVHTFLGDGKATLA